MLSSLMLYMTCMPCSDGEDCLAVEETKSSTSGSHEEQTDGSETCTPFCTCACCALVFNSQAIASKLIPPLLQGVIFRHTNDDVASQNLQVVWQPPRLC